MMRLHEYQAKSIFSKHGITVSKGKLLKDQKKLG